MEKTLFPNSDIKRSMLLDCVLKFKILRVFLALSNSLKWLDVLRPDTIKPVWEYKSLSNCIAVAHPSPVISRKGVWDGGWAF